MQAVHHSFREADSIVCGLDCITKHIPREWLWGVFLFPCSFPLIFTFLLLHILKQNLIALALLEDVSWDLVCIYWAGTRPVIIQACSQGYFQSYWSFFFSESLWPDSLLYSFKRGTRIWTCGGLRKAKTISAMQAWNPEGAWVLALLPVHLPRSGAHEVCTCLHIPAPGAASAELIFLAEQQAESKLINHLQLIRLAFLCVSRERNGGAGEKTSVVQPALEKAVNMEFMQILLFILFLDTPASVPQCL